MRCPHDGRQLQSMVYEGAIVQTCPSCGGEFLSGETLAYVVSTRQERFGPEWQHLLRDHEPLHGLPEQAPGECIGCPACDAPMRPVNYCGDTTVLVDRCTGCGAVWLDSHELEMVQVLLERWQDRAPERLRAIAGDLEERRRRAAAAGDDAYRGSRFAFVNALVNRLLDAA